MQVYQSLRLAGLEGEPVALGAWYFSNDQRGLERRLYLSIKAETTLAYGTVCAAAFRAHFLDADIRASPVGSPFASAWYAVAPSLGEGASARLALMCCLDWTQWKRECRQNECGRLACRSMRRLLSSVIKLIIAGAGLLDAIVGANAIVTYQVALFIVVACVPVREVRTIQEHGEL